MLNSNIMVRTKYSDIYIDDTYIYKYTRGKYHRLSQWIDNVGYYQVVFRINGKRKYIRVHRLIAETLLPNPKNLQQIDHIDGNKLNNKLSNLEWVSNAINTQRGYDNNLYLFPTRSYAISAIEKGTSKKYIFKSIRACSEYLHLNRKTISAILNHKKTNNYNYDFSYITECVSTNPDECTDVKLETGTSLKQETISNLEIEDIVSADGDIRKHV